LQLSVNGQTREVADGMTVSLLLEALEVDPRKVAVERNREIVPKSAFERTSLDEDDEIEIVQFVGGG
jgi:thiamine biosynthesis protein ThiS